MFEQLEQQIKEIQKEIERLKRQQERSKLPSYFNRTHAILFLENLSSDDLNVAFSVDDTPQGEDYWLKMIDELDNPNYQVPLEAIIQIQSWVIESYKEQYGVV